MKNKPKTVAEYFAQFANNSYPIIGLECVLENGSKAKFISMMPWNGHIYKIELLNECDKRHIFVLSTGKIFENEKSSLDIVAIPSQNIDERGCDVS